MKGCGIYKRTDRDIRISPLHTVPEFRSTQIYSERSFLYICSQRPQKMIKFGENIVLTKMYVFTKFRYSMMYTKGDIKKKPLRINLGRAKFWNSVYLSNLYLIYNSQTSNIFYRHAMGKLSKIQFRATFP